MHKEVLNDCALLDRQGTAVNNIEWRFEPCLQGGCQTVISAHMFQVSRKHTCCAKHASAKVYRIRFHQYHNLGSADSYRKKPVILQLDHGFPGNRSAVVKQMHDWLAAMFAVPAENSKHELTSILPCAESSDNPIPLFVDTPITNQSSPTTTTTTTRPTCTGIKLRQIEIVGEPGQQGIVFL